MELAEIDQALDDVLGLLHEVEADLLHFDLVSGDPNYSEMLVNNIQVCSLRDPDIASLQCTLFLCTTYYFN